MALVSRLRDELPHHRRHWLAHHGLFRRLRYADSVLIRLNLLLLMVVAFLPFPTRLVAEAIDVTDAERTAVLFYGATLFSISVLITAMGRHAASHEYLVVEGERGGILALARRTAPSLGFYGALILVVILVPTIAAFGFLAVALSIIVRSRGVGADGRQVRWPAWLIRPRREETGTVACGWGGAAFSEPAWPPPARRSVPGRVSPRPRRMGRNPLRGKSASCRCEGRFPTCRPFPSTCWGCSTRSRSSRSAPSR